MSLKLLQSYESDGSSTEDDDDDGHIKEVLNISTNNYEEKQRLPLPTALTKMFLASDLKDSSTEAFEDPLQHDGRVRSFAHVRGNWASFVNISLNESEAVDKQKTAFEMTLLDFPDHGIRLCSDFHLSLTKTLLLRHHWIDAFISTLKEKFGLCERFDVVYDEFEVYENEEKTRTFIGMKVHSSNQLQLLIRECDTALAEYNLEPYYEDASFHVSIGWTLGTQAEWLKKSLLPYLNSAWRKALDEDATLQLDEIASIRFKTGNKLYEFPLESRERQKAGHI